MKYTFVSETRGGEAMNPAPLPFIEEPGLDLTDPASEAPDPWRECWRRCCGGLVAVGEEEIGDPARAFANMV
jgi:hypothetical protein